MQRELHLQLIETMRWEPRSGFPRLDRHLARLYASAAELGFACAPESVGKALGDAVAGASAAFRIRLALAGDGTPTVTAQSFEPLPVGKIWRLKLARTRLDSGDPLLRHKTSRRDIYVRARAEHLVSQADEVLLLNERGEVCEGTITNIFADLGDGVLVTPPLACGLLPGVLRAELIETGQARESVLDLDELRTAKSLFVGNSLRGMIPARLS